MATNRLVTKMEKMYGAAAFARLEPQHIRYALDMLSQQNRIRRFIN
jgi:hypothetical protein